MRFYRIEVPIREGLARNECRRKEYQEWSLLDGLTVRMAEYYRKSGGKKYFLAANVWEGDDCNHLALAAFLEGTSDPEQEAEQILDTLGVVYDHPSAHELTVRDMVDLVEQAFMHDTFDLGTEEVWRLLGFPSFDHISRGFGYAERMVEETGSLESILGRKELAFCRETLKPELERIFQGRSLPVTGIPVHYLVSTGDERNRTAVVDALIDSLAQNGRINSRRVCELTLDDETNYDSDDRVLFETFYRASVSGAVVISYTGNNEAFGSHRMAGSVDIGYVCNIIEKYRESVLTILCLPLGENALERSFRENLDSVDMVEIRTHHITSDDAKAYLQSRAREKSLAPSEDLCQGIIDGQLYDESVLNDTFARWYARCLKTHVYPQYAYRVRENAGFCKREVKGAAFRELQDLVGLESVKRTIQKIVDYRKVTLMQKERGILCNQVALHMLFTGNPGTAKTTVARLFARIIRENQLLPIGNLIEVGRAGLVGRYVGWTAPLVKRRFEQARGSVLFIDEAYALLDGQEGEYGDEAINAIVQEMENHREDTIVIFAGYPDKMEKFMSRNPGLRSRIAFHINFDDYTAEELYGILEEIAKSNHIALAEDVRETVVPLLYRATSTPDFGNGRFVRNIFEQACMNQSARVLKNDGGILSIEQLSTLCACDFKDIDEWHTELRRKTEIGFLG